jgi:hypothetical protein
MTFMLMTWTMDSELEPRASKFSNTLEGDRMQDKNVGRNHEIMTKLQLIAPDHRLSLRR